MPRIDSFNGIKIYIYNGDHRPPHIHAIYAEYEVLIIIETGKIYAGDLPTKQLKIVLDWVYGNSDWLINLFYELNPELK
jgi:hypothetical protein